MSEAHRFDPTVLREYDVRGVVCKTLSERDAAAIGRAFGTYVAQRGGRRVCVGYDGRLSSPGFAAAVRDALAACGHTVIDVGRGPTPMLYYSVRKLRAKAGIMITGSHNPPDYNGFKMLLDGGPVYGAVIQQLGRIAAAGRYAVGRGRVEHVDFLPAYVERLYRTFAAGGAKRMLRVAWDAGNGAAGEAMARLCKRLPGRHFLLNAEIDGLFPNHHPDPTVEKNLEQLRATVLKNGCDLGIAFDGDGDRIGVVDSKARILWADQLMVILARPLISRGRRPIIIADVKASQVFFDEVARMGGRPLMWKTGHSLIKAKMKEVDSPFSGEMSGHIFYRSQYGFDDALYVAVKLLQRVRSLGQSLAELRDELPQPVNTPELRFQCPEERKFAVVDEVRARLKQAKAKMKTIDGVRVQTPDGWWLLRASNTQDVLVARCEAADEAGLGRLKAALIAELTRSGVAIPQL
ncbi:MAG: phosphomannomutase/phosphoglucomutase [Proteobacteria bacterium]|nr:phosphomannomutase/phosphoglucomutase [Pseudomonadota bacterium]